MSDAALLDAARQAHRDWLAAREHRDRLGRICAYLHDQRDWTWQRIADEHRVDVTTARRWAEPYLQN